MSLKKELSLDELEPALKLIREFEGLRLHAYQDPVGVWTIGYGTTEHVRPGQVITIEQAEWMLRFDVERIARKIQGWVKVPISTEELCAMVSLSYNIGLMAFHYSTLLAKLNRHEDRLSVAHEFLRWVYAGGHKFQGLVNRRTAEKILFLSGR